MIKLLIGGSPCTYWSIAQKNGRETEAEGMGWELFKNYLIAKEKFKPDFFLYENNKSAAQAIKDQISRELGVELMHINSALVSAQNRQRFYAFNWEVEQPEDRGILLRDILESTTTERSYSLSEREIDYMVRGYQDRRWNFLNRPGEDDKSKCVVANFSKGVPYNILAEPVGVGYRNRREEDGKLYRRFETHGEEKSNALTTVQTDSMVAEPIRIGTIESEAKNKAHDSKQYRVYSPDGKSTTLCGQGGGVGAKTGLYAVPCDGGKAKPIYEVKDGLITIKDKQYPIKLADGFYIIRKLTVTECCRLQTMPDDYCRAVSNSQAYKGLGNGWTAEVIIHILNGTLKDVPRDEEIVVLSMYDGIGTGRYCLDKMGFTNVKYYAYEIDKYAMEVSMSNYPDIIQMGDAFDVRKPDWELEG
jgi:DNA (cytosine-5)-methyltransferase 3A